jgi:hypothetical protein
LTLPIIGLSCANCGKETTRPEARELAYAVQVSLECPGQAGQTVGVASFRFAVMRPTGPDQSSAMLLCDGCMGAALKAVCEGILSDMEALSGASSGSPS